MRRTIPLLAASAAATLLASGCGGFGGGGSGGDGSLGTITFYSPETPDMTEEMAAAFEKTHDADVQVEYGGTNVIVNKLMAEQNNPRGDVWYGGGGFLPFENALDDGLIQAYTPETTADMPETQGDVRLRDDEWGWVGAELFVLGVAYDPEKVSEDELPDSWADLADERWADELQFPNPSASGTATLLVLSQLMTQGEDEGWEYFDALVDNASAIPDSGAAPTQAVGQGEASIAVGYDFMAFQAAERGESVAFHIPEETPVLVNPVTMVADAPNEEGAQAFIDWMMSTEGQQVRADWGMIPLDPEVEAKTDLTLDQVEEHAQELDVDWVVDNYDLVRDEWRTRFEV
ncbi:ABC transporter substrate-binding protein [Nocardiopsis coralliicola]